jgi:hypothetical protein
MPSNGHKKNQMVLFAIHRHWIWADRMRAEYFERIKANPPTNTNIVEWFLTGDGMYLCLWFGLEFAVCEALHGRKISVSSAQKEIDGIYKSLNLFRNTVFHIQPEYLSPKMFKLLNDPTHRARIDKVHKEIGEWLLNEISE